MPFFVTTLDAMVLVLFQSAFKEIWLLWMMKNENGAVVVRSVFDRECGELLIRSVILTWCENAKGIPIQPVRSKYTGLVETCVEDVQPERHSSNML
jgi:hypothetical protein